MNLITRVTPLGLGRWLCEVFVVGGERIAYAETPKDTELTQPNAERFAEMTAMLCKNMPREHYNIHTLRDTGGGSCPIYPLFVNDRTRWVTTEKIGEANLPRQKEEA
jgi:hypothetical protein